ncbi:hypothetical protein ES703_84734 [subsurface metagenome]
MWEAKHKPECTDRREYEVTRNQSCIEDIDGNVFDADKTGGEVASAECRDCGAEAKWVA